MRTWPALRPRPWLRPSLVWRVPVAALVITLELVGVVIYAFGVTVMFAGEWIANRTVGR